MPTKLELCIDIADSLWKCGPLTAEQLTSRLEVNSLLLEQQLEFLVGQEMVKKEETGLSVTYIIAGRGIMVLEFFKVLPSTRIAV